MNYISPTKLSEVVYCIRQLPIQCIKFVSPVLWRWLPQETTIPWITLVPQYSEDGYLRRLQSHELHSSPSTLRIVTSGDHNPMNYTRPPVLWGWLPQETTIPWITLVPQYSEDGNLRRPQSHELHSSPQFSLAAIMATGWELTWHSYIPASDILTYFIASVHLVLSLRWCTAKRCSLV